MISAGVTVMDSSGSVEGTTGSITAPLRGWLCNLNTRTPRAMALVHDPEILILDEPASGLDPRARIDLRGLLGELAAMGKTVIISSHILAELEEMCSHVAILDGGRVLAQGAPGDIGA